MKKFITGLILLLICCELNAQITDTTTLRYDINNWIIPNALITANKLNQVLNGEVNLITIKSSFNIKDHGADTTGVSDVSALVQAAINAGYKSIEIPAGTYLFASTVYMKDSVTVNGYGASSVIKLTGNFPAFKLRNLGVLATIGQVDLSHPAYPAFYPNGYGGGGYYCQFNDFSITGTAFNNTTVPLQSAIVIDTVHGVSVNRVKAYNLGGYLAEIKNTSQGYSVGAGIGNMVNECWAVRCFGGIYLDNLAQYTTVLGGHFMGGTYGIFDQGANNTLSGNIITSDIYGLRINGSATDGQGIATGNTIQNCVAGLYITNINRGYYLDANLLYSPGDSSIINNSKYVTVNGGYWSGETSKINFVNDSNCVIKNVAWLKGIVPTFLVTGLAPTVIQSGVTANTFSLNDVKTATSLNISHAAGLGNITTQRLGINKAVPVFGLDINHTVAFNKDSVPQHPAGNGNWWLRINPNNNQITKDTLPNMALPTFQASSIPFANISGILTTDSTLLGYTAGNVLIGATTTAASNSIFLNNGRAEMMGSFGGMSFNVGSGYPGGGTYDASKGYLWQNRGNTYMTLGSASSTDHRLTLASNVDAYFTKLGGSGAGFATLSNTGKLGFTNAPSMSALTLTGPILLTSIADPAAPAAGAQWLYANTAGIISFMGSNGFALNLAKGRFTASHKVEFQNLDYTLGDSARIETKEPIITPGTSLQYYRGDKTMVTLDKTAVGLVNVDNTSDAAKNAATATLTNKTLQDFKVVVAGTTPAAMWQIRISASTGTITLIPPPSSDTANSVLGRLLIYNALMHQLYTNDSAIANLANNPPNSTQDIVTGTATTVTAGVIRVYVNPTSVLASHTITTPASPQDGEILRIYFGGTIAIGAAVVTSLTIAANTGSTLYQSITPLSANGGDNLIYQYKTATAQWVRLIN